MLETMSNPHRVLFRPDQDNKEEYDVAKTILGGSVVTQRTDAALKYCCVVGRYSVLPYYKELEKDLATRNCWLINTYRQHNWIADFEYYSYVEPFTFKTYFDPRDIPSGKRMVVKGRTNSRKQQWSTKMYAEDRRQAVEIGCDLMTDPLIGTQGVIYREYEQLEVLEYGINGLPFTNEHRVFYFGSRRLCHGFYWSQSEKAATIQKEGLDLADYIATIVSQHANFFVLDMAKTATGEWRLVEINDGQMSGLSCIDPIEFYGKIKNLGVLY